MVDRNLGNRMVAFCEGAPAPTVVRVHVHAGGDPAHRVEVERVYGAPAAATTPMATRFASIVEDETLLVALAKDGAVLGTAWPVYKENVSLEMGIPDMTEAEAAGLLESPQCSDGLRALRDRGARPVSASASGGCAHCATSPGSSLSSELPSMLLFVLAVAAGARAVRARHRVKV